MPVRDKLHAVAGLTDWKRRFETLQNELEMIFRIVERKVAILDGERHGSLYRTAKVFEREPILLAARSLVEALLNQYEQDFQDLETAKYDIKASIKAAEAAQAEHEKKRKEAYAAGCAYQDKAWTDRYSETIQQHFDRGRREEYDNWQKYQDGIRAECRKTVEKEYDLHAIQAQRESWQEAETKYKSEIKGQNDQLAAKMGELARAKENHASNLTTELSAAEENLKKEHAKAVEEVNKTHKTEVEELKTSHSQVVRSVQDKHTATMLDRDGYKNDYEDGVREIQEHKKKIEKLEKGRDEDKRGREEDKRRHDEDKARTTRRHGEEIGRYETRLDQVKQDHTTRMGAQTTRHREDTNRLQQLHDVNIAEMQRNIDQMQSDHKFDQELLKKEFVAKMTSQEQQHDQRVSAMETTHATVVQRLETAHTSTRTRFELEISKLKQEHATELKSLEQRYMQKVSQMKTAYAAHVETLQTKHAEAHIGLKEQVQSYSGALLTRDIRDFTMLEMEDMKYLSDSDIKTRFELLKQEVDTLSRVEWKPNPKHWTNQIVKRLSSNQRVLRKQILQDSIWSLLHNFVFCSPFRLFGEEGETLEKQWNERCGKDSNYDNGSYIWPKPAMETERWRYATVAECRASLRKPVPSEWDHRVKLKRGFKASMDDLNSELATVLGELVVLDKSNIQILEKMTKRAANIWLEFALQRCRVLIVVSGSELESADERVKRVHGGTLELVATPILKRYGSSTGLDLALEGIVGGFDGEKVQISMS